MALSEADLQLVFEASGIKELIAQTKALNEAMLKLIAQGNKAEGEMDDLGKSAKKAGGDFGGLGNAMGGIGGLLSGMGLAIGASELFNLGKQAIGSAIAYETLSVQFEVFLGSAEKAQQVLGELNKFSIETPFTPDQVNAAGRSLLAFGVTADNLIPTMKQIGDVSAAVGKDYNELATIFGKAKTAGTIFAEDINQLTEAGVPIIDELAKVFGVATDQVKKLGSEGKIHFSDLEKAFANMTGEGGRFSGMMDKMSQSTEGLLSTIEGKLQDELRAIGQAMLPTVRMIAEGFEPAFAKLKQTLTAIFAPVGDIMTAFSELFNVLGLGSKEGNSFVTIVNILSKALEFLFFPTKLIFEIIGSVVGVVADAIKWFGDAKKAVYDFAGQVPFASEALKVLESVIKFTLAPLLLLKDGLDAIFGESAAPEQSRFSKEAQQLAKFAVTLGGTQDQINEFSKSLKAADFVGLSHDETIKKLTSDFIRWRDELEKAARQTFTKVAAPELKKAFTNIGNAAKEATKAVEQFGFVGMAEGFLLQQAMDHIALEKERADALRESAAAAADLAFVFAENAKTPQPIFAGITDMDVQLAKVAAFKESIKEQFGELAKSVRDSMVSMAGDVAYNIGVAIGSGASIGDVFKNAIRELLVEVPKMAGMALLNAAIFPGNAPIALPLAVAGLALMGLSGLAAGIQQRNEAKRADQEVDMGGIAGSNVNGRSSPQGLGQANAASMPPIQLQINLDGAVLAQQMYGHLNKERIKRR